MQSIYDTEAYIIKGIKVLKEFKAFVQHQYSIAFTPMLLDIEEYMGKECLEKYE